MDRREFSEIVENEKRRHPKWFELESDGPATESAVCDAESTLGVMFSKEYREFLRDYGGGYFGFVLVLGVMPGSPWSVVDLNSNTRISRFVAVTDSGMGDIYGHSVDEESRCRASIDILDHEDRSVHRSAFSDFYDMVVRLGLSR